MADVAGLVIGAVALASLFSTCVELFDYFELGRNYACDYRLACTKLGLLRARLSQWGDVLNVAAPGGEHPVLRDCWPSEGEIVGRSLLGIQSILDDTTLLLEKYNVERRGHKIIKSLTFQAKHIIRASTDSNPRLIRRRTIWAIHDKGKFDTLIQELSFLIENLERVIDRLRMPSQSEKEAQEAFLTRCSEALKADTSSTSLVLREKHDQQHVPRPLTDRLLRATEIPEDRSTIIIEKGQTNENRAIGVQGAVDPQEVHIRIAAEQSNKNFSIGIQGVAGADGIVKLAQIQRVSAQENSQSNGANSTT
ncbi:MAG: hypothetical protein Q9165_002428 [Trypethelium subeluteriae]